MVSRTFARFKDLLLNPRVSGVLLLTYSLILVLASIFPSGIDSAHFNVVLTDSPQHLSNVFGYSDAGSYLKASLELNELDLLSPGQHWVINLWPPGMVLLNATLIHLFGNGYAIAYAVLISIIWTILGWLFSNEIRKHFGLLVSYLALSFFMLCSPLQTWVFDSGLFYAEGISIASFLFGLIFLIKGFGLQSELQRLSYAVIGGTFVAIAAYFRSTFSTLETSLLLVLLLLLAQTALRWKSSVSSDVRRQKWSQVRFVSVAWFSAFTLMEPWLQFTQHFIRGVRAWSVVGGSFFRNVWVDRSEAAGFMQSGGVGWGCEINTEVCNKIQTYEASSGQAYPIGEVVWQTLLTILTRPIEYISDRLHYLTIGWFSNEVSMGAMSVASGIALLLLFIVTLFGLLKKLKSGSVPSLFVLISCLLLIAPVMVGHVEPRYFIPLKILFVIYPWLIQKKAASSSEA